MQLSPDDRCARDGCEQVVNTTPSPLVQRRRLRTELRRARIGADLTQEQVAKAMDWHPSKIIRIETGAVGISTNDLRALLGLYKIHDSERTDELIEIARASRQSSWSSKYRGRISSQFLQYIEYEEAASVLRTYEPLVVPGLLQTEEYADTIIRKHADAGTPADLIQTRMEIRLTRQHLLEQPSPPTSIFVLDQAAVQRLVGERNIARGQLDRLINLATRPNITIEVVPFSAGLHRGMLEAFLILEFSEPEDSDVLFVETSRDLIVSHDEAGEISGYLEVFNQLRSISLGYDRTLAYLTDLIKQIP
jgi:transcriptional regulator with XRE-family HTH domain